MSAIEIGRLCIKLAGRDAGKECLIIDILDKNFVLVDGNTRRRKCNVGQLEFSSQKAELKKGATHEEVLEALKGLGIKIAKKKASTKIRKAKESEKEKKKAT
jgi:large subunit ribosomal protein L14e